MLCISSSLSLGYHAVILLCAPLLKNWRVWIHLIISKRSFYVISRISLNLDIYVVTKNQYSVRWLGLWIRRSIDRVNGYRYANRLTFYSLFIINYKPKTMVSYTSISGVVKVGLTAVGSFKVTEGSPVWIHWYVGVLCPFICTMYIFVDAVWYW